MPTYSCVYAESNFACAKRGERLTACCERLVVPVPAVSLDNNGVVDVDVVTAIKVSGDGGGRSGCCC